MADHVDIPIDQYSDISYTFKAYQIDQSPLDLTTATNIVLTVKKTLADTTPLDTYNLSSDISIVDAVEGEWEVTFPHIRTSGYPITPLVYDIYIVYGSKQYRACQGSLVPNKSVLGA